MKLIITVTVIVIIVLLAYNPTLLGPSLGPHGISGTRALPGSDLIANPFMPLMVEGTRVPQPRNMPGIPSTFVF